MSKYNSGDSITVSYTGVVKDEMYMDEDSVYLNLENGKHISLRLDKATNVVFNSHKIFGPGNLIRHKPSGSVYLITTDGDLVCKDTGITYFGYKDRVTSEMYEEVVI